MIPHGSSSLHEALPGPVRVTLDPYIEGEPPQGRDIQSSYNDKAGELIDKEQYTRQFLNQRNKEAGYHYDNIATVLNLVVKNAIAMREALTMADYIHKYEDRLMSMQASTFAKIGSGAYRAGARSRAVLHENLPRLSQYRRCICQSGRCIRTNLSPPMGPVQRQSFHRCADALR